jgi:pSer/pThr/pTyr-binding forkhead associated (FHA) protein/DNA-binding CsgD family transcriptional regulator
MRVLPPALRSVSPSELAQRIEVERRGVPFLLYLEGQGAQRIAELGGRTSVSVGRLASTDVPLTWDTEVSRVHALLECVGDEWTVADDGLSRNGTFVNGERVRGRRRLADGDSILVGRTLLVFVCARNGDSRTTAASRHLAPPPLSPAQQRVLAALCEPLLDQHFAGPRSNREIAERLFLSVETVKRHLHDLFERFGVADLPQNRKRAELARMALEQGAVDFEPHR